MPPNTTDNEDETSPNPKSKPKQTPLRKPSTPQRRTSAVQKRTPNSAPVRKNTTGAAGKKNGEPTLFQDFLLGRPSPARVGTAKRRRSLDVVKREIRLGEVEVGKLGGPGKVKERVMQWQRSSTAVVSGGENLGEVDGDGVADKEKAIDKEKDTARIRNSQKRPGRRKSKEAEHASPLKDTVPKIAVVKDRERSKSAAAPKKRVISDDHWMKKAAGVPKKSPQPKVVPIPKDFLQRTALNPPVERKIDDWIKRSAGEELEEPSRSRRESPNTTPRRRKVDIEDEDTPTRRKSARRSPKDVEEEDHTPRRRKTSRRENGSDGIRIHGSTDDGIRVRPSPDPEDDGIHVKPSRDNSFSAGDDSIRIKPIRKERRTKDEEPIDHKTPRKTSNKHLKPPETESGYTMGGLDEDEDASSLATPSRRASRTSRRKSGSPTETASDIPVGHSAFSVLELPVGAEAGTMRRPTPKRTPSFGMPKVLKKVYSEGLKIVHDTVDPPRVGLNQPPSIESWLNGTSDPFVDRPATSASDPITAEPPSRMPSYKEDDQAERELMDDENTRSRRKRRVQSAHNLGDATTRENPTIARARETLPSMERSPSHSPNGLRRSPATRITSSPKATKLSPFKEALLDAFRGESSYRSKGGPLADLSGFRDNRNPQESDRDHHESTAAAEDPPFKPSPKVARHVSISEKTNVRDKPLPAFPRRMAPTTGEHRLSTIASVETFITESSASDTASELSHTTVTQSTLTQSTAFTAPTASTLSRSSKASTKSALKRRLTKHSDLVSVLSLPDAAAPGRTQSIRSARSVRTNRSHLETATVHDLMRELADDETKYMRELKTLVDGVIPVLLTCVMSKSDSAVAAGLFDTEGLDASFTKPIVDMGIALERLKSLHNRIPLDDSKAFLTWLQGSLKSYDDYLAAWRMGFQDVVVNLAPASRGSSAAQSPAADEMPQNANGDVLGSNGQRVDVAFLLKRPLVRIKHLLRIVKGLSKSQSPAQFQDVMAQWDALNEKVRRRIKEEAARLEDRAANNTDTTRARDPQTLALAENAKIDRTRQVLFKDDYSLDMSHSTGQRIECHIELIIRDKPSDKTDLGDILIVASNVDEVKKWLLFPPIEKQYISARMGDAPGEVVVMLRSSVQHWHELFLLRTDDHDAAADLVDTVGSSPMPPKIIPDDVSVVSKLTESHISIKDKTTDLSVKDTLEVPIGERSRKITEQERVRRELEEEAAKKIKRGTPFSSSSPSVITEESVISRVEPKNLNEAMKKAGKPAFTATNHARARYHSRSDSQPSPPPSAKDVTDGLWKLGDYDCVQDDRSRKLNAKHEYYMSGGLGDAPTPMKETTSPIPVTPKQSTPLKESMRPESNALKKEQPAISPPKDEAPPPTPPAHRVPTTPNTLKKTPILDSPTPQAKNRRTSSPLKHEYQPSVASETSSSSEASDSEDSAFSDSSDEDEPDFVAEIPPPPHQIPKRSSPPVSLYNLPNGSVAPSNSASQAPYRGIPTQPIPGARKLIAFISAWDDKHGRYVDLHSDPCSIVVSPGKIEAFEMSAAHSSPRRDQSAPPDAEQYAADEVRPLIEQGLTPHVTLRRGTAVDLNIASRPTSNSLLKVNGSQIRYRTNTVPENVQLYNLVHTARMQNPVFIKLEQDRILNSYGTNVYDAALATNRRRSFFGRKNSYRASTRAPSTAPSDDRSLSSSTVSRLRRMSGSMFNIGKSTIAHTPFPSSQYGSSSNSTATTPPRSPSLAGTTTSGLARMGNENLKIRLYYCLSISTWDDRGAARITITAPPPGMRPRTTMNQGITRRVIVTQELKDKEGRKTETVVLDDILGADCFSKMGTTGVVCQIWDEVRGDDGQVGTVGKEGGVSGRMRKWCFQTGRAGDADWILSLCSIRG